MKLEFVGKVLSVGHRPSGPVQGSFAEIGYSVGQSCFLPLPSENAKEVGALLYQLVKVSIQVEEDAGS